MIALQTVFCNMQMDTTRKLSREREGVKKGKKDTSSNETRSGCLTRYGGVDMCHAPCACARETCLLLLVGRRNARLSVTGTFLIAVQIDTICVVVCHNLFGNGLPVSH
jgi:hypothetical protein